ncbi:hypothetical protein D1819_18535 [Pseudoalteromonas tunicata]|nr:hypothetical protein D1819_18535 [Pseudoalteromonas tunicata]
MFEVLAIFFALTAIYLFYLTSKYQNFRRKPLAKKYRGWACALVMLSFLSLLVVKSAVASVFSLLVLLMLLSAILPFCSFIFKGTDNGH